MPIGFRNFRSIPTKLKLNGPILRYTTDPKDSTEQFDGTAVFNAEAIAEFTVSSEVASGGYNFTWYLDGNKLDPDDGFSLVQNILTKSTLTLTNISVEDNNKLVYCEVEYQPVSFEGEGHNAPLKSNVVSLTAFPELEITTQPTNQSVGVDVFANYSCEAQVVPTTEPQDVKYQWQIGGDDLVDGTSEANGLIPLFGTVLTVTSDRRDYFEIDFATISTFSDWKTDRTYNLVCNKDVTAEIYAIGGGGGGSGFRNVGGPAGGSVQGTFTFLKDQNYKLQIGSAGGDANIFINPNEVVPGGFPGGGNSGSSPSSTQRGGGGGGYTGLFIDSVAHSNSILVAGGGGGSSWEPSTGGRGGGETGFSGFNGGGDGGTQTTGGSGFLSGSMLQGGNATFIYAAGGGAGYYGGGAGNVGSGGGGSSYFHPSLVTNGSYSRVNSESPQFNDEKDGSFKIVKVTPAVTSTITVSGSNTKDLSIKTNSDDFGADIRCKVSSDSSQNSPQFTNTVNLQSFQPSPVLVMEAYDTINKKYKMVETYLENSSTTLNSSTFGSEYNLINFYSKEGNFNFKLDIIAAAGKDTNSFTGGEGGTSTIEINAKRETEYTILGISNNSAIFIYEKARLIACIGQGGSAGSSGSGGDGGGVNVDGRPGSGLNPGFGGERPVSGTLDLNGSYGSVLFGSNVSLYTDDTIKEQQDGGKTISCTKGSYYINQGFSPCEDVSEEVIKFVDNSGTTFEESSQLYRGFKSGYTITDTAGAGADDSCGSGGNGATGGDGGSNKSGGGGGSGYVDDSVVVISTAVGGNKEQVSQITFSV